MAYSFRTFISICFSTPTVPTFSHYLQPPLFSASRTSHNFRITPTPRYTRWQKCHNTSNWLNFLISVSLLGLLSWSRSLEPMSRTQCMKLHNTDQPIVCCHIFSSYVLTLLIWLQPSLFALGPMFIYTLDYVYIRHIGRHKRLPNPCEQSR